MDLVFVLLLIAVVLIAVVLAACYYVSEPLYTAGGSCGVSNGRIHTKLSRGRTIISPDNIKVDVSVSRKALEKEIGRFRANASTCTQVNNKQNICKETVEFYKKLREELVRQDPENADKTIVQRHFLSTCPYCIRSQPTWSSIVNEYLNGGKNRKFIFLENNEAINRTPGISGVPTIIKMTPEAICKHDKSSASYEELHKWIES